MFNPATFIQRLDEFIASLFPRDILFSRIQLGGLLPQITPRLLHIDTLLNTSNSTTDERISFFLF